MIQYQLNTHQWVQLPRGIREEMAKLFHMERHGNALVHGGVVISDGFTHEDLSAITSEKINAMLDTDFEEEDILKAVNALVATMQGEPKQEEKTHGNKSTTIRTVTGTEGLPGEGSGVDSKDKHDPEQLSATSGSTVKKPA